MIQLVGGPGSFYNNNLNRLSLSQTDQGPFKFFKIGHTMENTLFIFGKSK